MANRFIFPRETAFDANGDPLPGAKLEFYEAGTTNPADSFADEALTIANANPVIADSAGRFGDIFLQAIDYKVILKDAADVTIWTADPVAGTIDATGDKFIPSQQSPADMTVLIGPGTIWDAVAKTRLVIAAQTSPLMVAPVSNPRHDIVYVDRVTGAVGVQTGAEAVSPVDPTIPDGKLPVARVRLATTTIEIDASLIDDIRELEQIGDFGPQDIQKQSFTAFNDTGAANAYVITPVPAITAYAKYQTWIVDIANANTGASTMNINGLGTRNIFDHRTGAALVGGEVLAGINTFVDDGTRLILMTPSVAAVIAPSAFSARLLHVRDVKLSGTAGGASSSGVNIRVLNTEQTNEISGGGLVWALDYDAQTANFTLGDTLTGGTSAATATIVADADAGATGTLKIINITGTFQDNETITDGSGGSATSNIPSGVVAANQVYLPVGDYHASGSAPAFDSSSQQTWVYDVTGAAVLVLGTTASIAVNADLRCFSDGRFSLATPSLIEFQHYIAVGRANGLGIASGSVHDEVYADLLIWKI